MRDEGKDVISPEIFCPRCGEKLAPLYYREKGETSNLRVKDRFFCANHDKVVKVNIEVEA